MDPKELGDVLLNAKTASRDAWFNLLRKDVFKPVFNYDTWEETRDHPYRKLKTVTDSKLVSVTDFATNPRNIFLAHEYLAMVDPSTAIKFTVQFNLFGGSVFALCTDRHKHLFNKIDDLSVCGCFCLTELGYGNNAVKMETRADYDKEKKEFVINTPTTLSQKYWISNGYRHANNSLVFAQLYVDGKHEGVHAFLVPIRGKDMKPLPGVSIIDMGVKFGLNGVDNAALKYKDVRIPREYMMNRYSDVNENGAYSNELKHIPSRFFKVTERLLSGRICIASIALGGTKACMYIACRYGQLRKSIGPEGESSVPILNYQLQQNALMPLLCRTLALNCLQNYVTEVYKKATGKEHDLLMLCCIAKTMLGWNFQDVATTCRERCGGMGYLANCRFGEFLACAGSCLTAEGDNRVLMTKITKDYITGVKNKKMVPPSPNLAIRSQIGSFPDVSQLDTLIDLFKFRERTLFNNLMRQMNTLQKQGKSQFEILMRECSDNIQALAMAYGERNTLEQSILMIDNLQNEANVKVMNIVVRVFAIDCVKKELGFYLRHKAINAGAARNLNETQNKLIKEVAANIEPLLASLNVPHDVLYVPIAKDYEKYYSAPNFGEVVGARL